MSNELGSAKVLLCPGDRNKLNCLASDFSTSTSGQGLLRNPGVTPLKPNYQTAGIGGDRSISYFISLDADETKPVTLLVADRNINVGGGAGGASSAVDPIPTLSARGFSYPGVNSPAPITRIGINQPNSADLHWVTGAGAANTYTQHELAGNFALGDGSVQQATAAQLRQQFQQSTNELGVGFLTFYRSGDRQRASTKLAIALTTEVWAHGEASSCLKFGQPPRIPQHAVPRTPSTPAVLAVDRLCATTAASPSRSSQNSSASASS